MREPDAPVVKDLVLVGGGHSHVAVLRSFGMDPIPGVRLTLVSRDTHAPYSGMLPGLIAGHYGFDDAHIDLVPLARFAGARFLHDEAVGLHLEARRVRCRERPPVAYDVLSIDIGSTPSMRGVEGAAGEVVPVKPIDGFWRRWERLRDRCLARRRPTRVAVVGGGAGGVELLLAVQHRLGTLLAAQGRDAGYLSFHLVTQTDEILPTHNRRVRRKFRRVLGERGVDVITGRRVSRVGAVHEAGAGDDDGLLALGFEAGGGIEAHEVLWVTTAAAQQWPAEAGLATDEAGFIKVADTLQSLSHPDVFAAGDIADVVKHPRPKAGVFAVRQGPPLTANLRRRLRGEKLAPFTPQRQFLSLISTGDRYAVASRSRWALEGAWVWRWKDWIDRRFMRRYSELPEMRPAAPFHVDAALADDEAVRRILDRPMRCAGCGSKVGGTVLARVLGRLGDEVGPPPPGLRIGLDAPDDGAVLQVPEGKLLVQSVDHFRALVDDPYVFGKVAAIHALGDLWAMGAEPRVALAMVTLPLAVEAKLEEDLTQLLTGASRVLRQEGASLVGGHTAEGPELVLGLAVSGVVDADGIVSKRGLQAGDELVLTKPLGTGALFAAAMRGKAKGRWIDDALESMGRSSRQAARCLVDHGARAMTDVTGFGLVGHLLEMLDEGLAAEVDVAAVPVLDGALEVLAAGITSSLQADNVRLGRGAGEPGDRADDPRHAVLFDPQTAGGLLAGVPAGRGQDAVVALARLGYPGAAVVGRVTAAPGMSPAVTFAPDA